MYSRPTSAATATSSNVLPTRRSSLSSSLPKIVTRLPSFEELERRNSMGNELAGEAHQPLDERRMSPAQKKGLLRVLKQLKSDEELASTEVEFERRVNHASSSTLPVSPAEDLMIISPVPVSASMLSPLTYSTHTSKLNPENNYPSRLREEMRLSPCPQLGSPVNLKRKLSSAGAEDRAMDTILYRPMKPLKRMRATSRPPNFHHTRTNSGSSVASFSSDISMIPNSEAGGMESPRISYASPHLGLPLNLGSQTTDFSKMKLS
ncbi:hypothetical protein HDV03_000171 [Kappamyces sp. JEL0829]|nr:hypothetical protein HDV03_000171 [Kappamyces sp. JEL0829]